MSLSKLCENCGNNYTSKQHGHHAQEQRFCTKNCAYQFRALFHPEGFWKYVDKTGECWEWIGYVSTTGYGALRKNSVPYYAHRLSYELVFGSIPDGLVIDHKCRNKICVNPEHLEAVTQRENIHRRGCSRSECPKGIGMRRYEYVI